MCIDTYITLTTQCYIHTNISMVVQIPSVQPMLEVTKMRDAPILLGLFLWWWLDIRGSCFLSTTWISFSFSPSSFSERVTSSPLPSACWCYYPLYSLAFTTPITQSFCHRIIIPVILKKPKKIDKNREGGP